MADTVHPLTTMRTAHGLTQAQLAALVGCSQPAVAQWEGGQAPSTASLLALKRVLALSPEEVAALLSSYGGTRPPHD